MSRCVNLKDDSNVVALADNMSNSIDEQQPSLAELTAFTLESYVKLLKYLKKRYSFFTFCEVDFKATPYLILRHDVDVSPLSALKMAEIEKNLGIRSTYFILLSGPFYNILEGENAKILQRISKLGHEIGLHFWPEQYRRYEKDSIKTLRVEVNLLEHLVGKKVYSIARHGGVDQDPFAAIDSYINANHPYLRGDLFVHESDRAWFSLSGLSTLLNESVPRAQLLIHSENWQDHKMDRTTLLSRHIEYLEKRNLSLKRKYLEYYQSSTMINEYDKTSEKNTHLLSSRDISSHYAVRKKPAYNLSSLMQYYLVHTRLGWSLHNLKIQMHTKLKLAGSK
jgi:hypothetical protein